MFKKIRRIVGITMVVVFLFAAFYITYIRIADIPPGFFGYRFIRVSSESMEPELDVGEVLIVASVEPETLVKGDVITYKGEKSYLKDRLVTHQISKEPYKEDGVIYFTTRGIKPESVDDPEITEYQIIGKVTHKIPYVGTIYDFFTEWYGILLFFILVAVAFADDAISIYNKIREKRYIAAETESTNAEDLRQGEAAMRQRLNEFDAIITNLNDQEDL